MRLTIWHGKCFGQARWTHLASWWSSLPSPLRYEPSCTNPEMGAPAAVSRGRLAVLSNRLAIEASGVSAADQVSPPPPGNRAGKLMVVDKRTGRSYEVQVSEDGTAKATELKKITTGKDDKGLKLYHPGYLNTAPVRSTIFYIDGDAGILRYRGYPIEELAESISFLEVAYLLYEQ